MSIVSMKRLRLIALNCDRERIFRDLLRLGCVEISSPENVTNDPDASALVKREESLAPSIRAKITQISMAKDTLGQYAHVKKSLLAPRPAISESAFFDDTVLMRALEAAHSISESAAQLGALIQETGRLENLRAALLPWRELDVPLDTGNLSSCTVTMGVCPATADIPSLKETLSNDTGACELYPVNSDREQHYLLLLCHEVRHKEAMEVLKEAGFSTVQFKELTGTCAENLARIDRELKEIEKSKKAQLVQLSAFGDKQALLEQAMDMLGVHSRVEAARDKLLSTGNAFYLEGWAPASSADKLKNILLKYASAAELTDPQEGDNIPVKLHNSAFVAPMNMVTEMYSLPVYGSIDPNPLILPFFTLFFGFMYADIGYGAILCILSWVVLKKAKPHGMMDRAFKLMAMCGFTTILFGVLFGGFFGDVLTVVAKGFFNTDFVLPPLLLNPLERPMDTLYLSLGFGAVHIVTGMLVKAYMLIRDGKPWDALMDVGSWFLLFYGFVIFYLDGATWGMLAGAAALVLTQGRGSKNIFGKLFGGLASLYNVTSYLSDVLSYLRLMALCLATTVIASVVNTLGVMSGAIGFIVVFAAGHAFNMGINIIGTYVHAARLQYLEFFSKFYQDGGKPFEPLEISTRYVDVLKGEQ